MHAFLLPPSRRLLLLLLLVALLNCGLPPAERGAHDPAREVVKRPNLTLPTLGGTQFWADWRWRAGWRIQENVLTGHFRLLDPRDRRQAWGSWQACLQEFEQLAPPPQPSQQELIVLLHGMGRSHRIFARLSDALKAAGFAVASISYPSTRRSIEQHVEQLRELLGEVEGYRRIHFVSHSLGGILIRGLLAPEAPTPDWEVGRIVMMAPPNRGSAWAEAAQDKLAFRLLFGSTGRGLTPDALSELSIPQVPILVIAGARNGNGGWNPLLEGANDGVVRVDETHLEGESEHRVVHSLHTFIMDHPESIAATIEFLQAAD